MSKIHFSFRSRQSSLHKLCTVRHYQVTCNGFSGFSVSAKQNSGLVKPSSKRGHLEKDVSFSLPYREFTLNLILSTLYWKANWLIGCLFLSLCCFRNGTIKLGFTNTTSEHFKGSNMTFTRKRKLLPSRSQSHMPRPQIICSNLLYL